MLEEAKAPRVTRAVSVSPLSSPSKSPSGKRRKSNSLPPETVDYLKAWMMSPEHIAHPYPTEQEKAEIMADTGIELKQLTNWFVNNRKRFWKPQVEARLQEQAQGTGTYTTIDVTSPSKLSDLSLSGVATAHPRAFLLPPKAVEISRSMSTSSSSSSLSVLGSPGRVVSDQSESESVSSADDDVYHLSSGQQTMESSSSDLLKQTEYVNVHVLRPASGEGIPSLDDVTILNNVPVDRVLRVFENCRLTYGVSSDAVGNNQQVIVNNPSDRVYIVFRMVRF